MFRHSGGQHLCMEYAIAIGICNVDLVITATGLIVVSVFVYFHRKHQSCDVCLEDDSQDYQNCSVLYCVLQLCTVICALVRVGKFLPLDRKLFFFLWKKLPRQK